MSVRQFYTFLTRNFPDLFNSQLTIERDQEYVQGLYMDLNSIIHDITKRLFRYDVKRELTPEDTLIQNYLRTLGVDDRAELLYLCIGGYLTGAYKSIRPVETFMISVSGVAPKAKINQQRIRRMGNKGSPVDYFDPVMISPGTKFMDRLEKYITIKWIETVRGIFDQNVDIVFSGHRDFGEAEHKIFHHLNRTEKEIRQKTVTNERVGHRRPIQVVLGSNDDLGIIPFVQPSTHNIIFMRSNFKGNKEFATMDILEVAIHNLVKEYRNGNSHPKGKFFDDAWGDVFYRAFQFIKTRKLYERIGINYLKPFKIHDFVPIVTLCGNDFLPPIPEMDAMSTMAGAVFSDSDITKMFIRSHGKKYSKSTDDKIKSKPKVFNEEKFWSMFRYLETSWHIEGTNQINIKGAKPLRNHDMNRDEIYPLVEDSLLKVKRRILYTRTSPTQPFEEVTEDVGTLITALDIYRELAHKISSNKRNNVQTFLTEDRFKINYVSLYRFIKELYIWSRDLMKSHSVKYKVMLKEGKDPSCILEKSIGKDYKSKIKSENAIVPATFLKLNRAISAGIYDSKYADFNLPKQDIDEMCRKWLEGLQWTMKYYSEGMQSIDTQWFYPFRTGPCLYDLMNYLQNNISTNTDKFPYLYIPGNKGNVLVKSYISTGTYTIRPNPGTDLRCADEGEVQTPYVGHFSTIGQGNLKVFEGPNGQLCRWGLANGDSKIIDLDHVSIATIEKARTYCSTGFPEGVKIVIVVEGERADEIRVPVEFVFEPHREIMYAIDNKQVPYSSITETLFSIMPIRVLRLIFSPDLVDIVLSKVGDCYPSQIQVETENQVNNCTNVVNYPSPSRIKDAIETLPSDYSYEIATFNERKGRYYLVRTGEMGVSNIIPIKMPAEKISYTYPNRETHRKDKDERGTSVGGLGDSMGIVFPQYTQYMENLHPTETNPNARTVKIFKMSDMYRDGQLNKIEQTAAANIASSINPFPNPNNDVQWKYDIIPTTFPHSNRFYVPPNTYEQSSQMRGQLMQSIRFLSEYVIANRSVANENVASRKIVLCLGENLEYVGVLAAIFPFFTFELWSENAVRISEQGRSLPNLNINHGKFTPAIGFYYRSMDVLMIYSYESENKDFDGEAIQADVVQLEKQDRALTIVFPEAALLKTDLSHYLLLLDSENAFRLDGEIRFAMYNTYRSRIVNIYWDRKYSGKAKDIGISNIKRIFGGSYIKLTEADGDVILPTRKQFSHTEYANKLHYFNTFTRPFMKYDNLLRINELDVTGFTGSFDQNNEIYCLSRLYMMKLATSPEQKNLNTLPLINPNQEYRDFVTEHMKACSKFLGQSLYLERIPQSKYYGSYSIVTPYTKSEVAVIRNIVEYYSEIPGSLPYTNSVPDNVHHGQRKLLLGEISFLLQAKESDWVVYAGAAPSNKAAFLAALFPNKKFILVDPNNFNITPFGGMKIKVMSSKDILPKFFEKNPANIYVIQEYMTIELAQACKYLRPSFISDIRTSGIVVTTEDKSPTDADIVYNNAQQYGWVKTMKPTLSMLKFRHPFRNKIDDFSSELTKEIQYLGSIGTVNGQGGIDFIKDYKNGKLIYMDGQIMLQAWAPPTSTETRLITRGTVHADFGSHKAYEEKMFYYNVSMRPHHYKMINAQGFDDCGDCNLEYGIWSKLTNNPLAMIKETNKFLGPPHKK